MDVLEPLRRLRCRLEATGSRAPRPAAGSRLRLEPVETPHGVALCARSTLLLPPAVAAAPLPDPERLVFLDVETTGLAGGTGTYVFLVGVAWWAGAALRVVQYFLPDLDREAAFLAAIRAELARARRIVTYNGRTFDLPLLETRYLLARAEWWGAELPHLDLFPLARALWAGQVPDCRLTTLETHLLRLDRGDDIPGGEIPRLYFHYLRRRDPRPLPRLFAHNRMDLLGLAALTLRAHATLEAPRHPLEWVGAARWLERRDPERSLAYYEAALAAGLGRDHRWRVGWRLGRAWRRRGRWEAAIRLWEGLLADDPAPPLGLVVDLAKLYEHAAGDFAAALRLVRQGLARLEREADAGQEALAEALRHRERRLVRRLAAPRPRRLAVAPGPEADTRLAGIEGP